MAVRGWSLSVYVHSRLLVSLARVARSRCGSSRARRALVSVALAFVALRQSVSQSGSSVCSRGSLGSRSARVSGVASVARVASHPLAFLAAARLRAPNQTDATTTPIFNTAAISMLSLWTAVKICEFRLQSRRNGFSMKNQNLDVPRAIQRLG